MHLDRPVVCLVTDRRRLVTSGDRFEVARDALVRVVEEAVAAGVTLVQVREPGLETSQLADLVAAIVEVARGSRTLVVVNDRLDVALTSGAHGVHLRGDSIPPRAARSIAPPGFLVGRSVHHLEEARDHAPAVDYLIAGTVFPTPSKPAGTPLLGVGGLRSIAAAVRVPVLAIGGISIERIGQIAEAGAAGVAAVGVFIGRRTETGCGAAPLAGVVQPARRQFDSMKTAS